MDKIDILNFEFSTKAVRDIGIVEPVLSYLELKYNLNIIRACISDDFTAIIRRYNPAVIVTSNGIGTTEHFEMVKYASLKGIKVITFISEGDMVDIRENVEILFWGNNKDKVFYEFANLQWSEKNIELIRKHIPESVGFNLVCTGGTGFDRYKFLPLKSKAEFYNQYPQFKKFTKIIGLAGFPFYFFLSDMYRKDGQWNNMHLDHDAANIMGTQKEPLRKLYRQIIENNPDTLFILKYHPSDILKEYSEFYELNAFENTLSIYKEETIDDIINISDLWIGFESTTCLEAWLLGKTSFIANPDHVKFIRSFISDGSPHYGNFEQLNNAIQHFFLHGRSEDFIQLQNTREEVIRKVIGYGDGLNHRRAGDFIHAAIHQSFQHPFEDIAYIRNTESKYRNKKIRKYLRSLLYKTPFIWIPKVKKEYHKDQQKKLEYSNDDRAAFALRYKNALNVFYQKNQINLD